MDCPRCNGFMFEECEDGFVYWKCVNCGFRTDPVMEANRLTYRYPADFVASALLAELTLTWKRKRSIRS